MVAVNETSELWTTRLETLLSLEGSDVDGPAPDCCWFICNLCCWVMC